ncbi:hypothetical protein FHT32_003014 [Variovorax sp. SG517]|uniref:zinc ribbon domain-containing protein n=1 Tax=Variovorax sp. SG517 TaxID=2587117 RepID=UPI00159E0809|nr:zinc ribbon domain-containing protein [Variovorax sp. SG517]NVM89359.1 hypothetical protein [Variovorax sp. SG517]
MASICPVCSTENRDGANFCRSCGIKLSAAGDRIPPPPTPEREWATTAPAQLRAPTIPAPLEELSPAPPPARQSFFFSRSPASAPRRDDEQTVFMLHDDGLPHSPASSDSADAPASPPGLESSWAMAPERTKRPRRVRMRRPASVERSPRWRVVLPWLGLLLVAVAMIVAGWYGYGTRKAPAAVEESAPATEPAAPAVAPPPPAEPPPPAPEAPAATADPQAADKAADQASATPPAAEAAPAPAPKPAAKSRKQATPAAQPSPAAPEAAPQAAAAVPPPAPAAPAEPAAMCGDRNFIAKAQCMAAQCLKPEYKAHAQCEAVRRQQRLEEEKRNPTLIN